MTSAPPRPLALVRDCPLRAEPTTEIVELARTGKRVVYGCPACLARARRDALPSSVRRAWEPGGALWW